MISTTYFYRLSYQQQADALLANATFLLSRMEGNFIVDLYELDDILVEIFYEYETEDLVSVMAYKTSEKLKMFTNGANLKPRLTIRKENPSLHSLSEYYA